MCRVGIRRAASVTARISRRVSMPRPRHSFASSTVGISGRRSCRWAMSDLRIDVDDGVALVTIARPPVNALTMASYIELTATFEDLGVRDDVRCVVLTGAGDRAFSAGFDF